VRHGSAATGVTSSGRSSLRVMRLTANFLETCGLIIADKVCSFMSLMGLLLGGGDDGPLVTSNDMAQRKEQKLRSAETSWRNPSTNRSIQKRVQRTAQSPPSARP
jgi:hypothetical protein